MNDTDNLWKKNAKEVIELLEKREIQLEEVLSSNLKRIKEINPKVNAVVTLCDKEAANNISKKKKELQNTLLKGMPVLVKDITDVKGVRTTYGSKIFSNHMPLDSDLVVKTVESRGGVVLGKTNIPEFAAGSHTYNDLFGTTKNPWNLSLSAGGSSGGSAAALATGMAWFATGTDLGGSLRNPASWCGVVGLRPTPGLIPQGPSKTSFSNLSVNGPMARNVTDLSIFLDALVDHNNRDPLSCKKDVNSYHKNLNCYSDKFFSIGYTEDFGIFPCDKEVRDMTKNTVKLLENLGHDVNVEYPNMEASEETFQILRAYLFYSAYDFLLDEDAKLIKEEVLWNIKKGQKLNVNELKKADKIRNTIYQETLDFFDKYDFLIAPSSIVPPFNLNEPWVKKVENNIFNNYVSWLMIAGCVSLTSCPSMAISTSFSENGAPIGIQIIAPPHQEEKLLSFVKTIEDALNISNMVPKDIN